MTNTKKLIEFCKDLADDQTIELTNESRCELRGLILRSMGEVNSLEDECGASARDEAKASVEKALAPIRRRLFGCRA